MALTPKVDDFAKKTYGVDGWYGFGVDKAASAAALGQLAHAVLRGDVILNAVSTKSAAVSDDFTQHTLELTYAIRNDAGVASGG